MSELVLKTEGERVFEAEGWEIYTVIGKYHTAQYGRHVGCDGSSLDKSTKEYLNTSWLLEDMQEGYDGYDGAHCYGCRCKVPECIQALMMLHEASEETP